MLVDDKNSLNMLDMLRGNGQVLMFVVYNIS